MLWGSSCCPSSTMWFAWHYDVHYNFHVKGILFFVLQFLYILLSIVMSMKGRLPFGLQVLFILLSIVMSMKGRLLFGLQVLYILLSIAMSITISTFVFHFDTFCIESFECVCLGFVVFITIFYKNICRPYVNDMFH